MQCLAKFCHQNVFMLIAVDYQKDINGSYMTTQLAVNVICSSCPICAKNKGYEGNFQYGTKR